MIGVCCPSPKALATTSSSTHRILCSQPLPPISEYKRTGLVAHSISRSAEGVVEDQSCFSHVWRFRWDGEIREEREGQDWDGGASLSKRRRGVSSRGSGGDGGRGGGDGTNKKKAGGEAGGESCDLTLHPFLFSVKVLNLNYYLCLSTLHPLFLLLQPRR